MVHHPRHTQLIVSTSFLTCFPPISLEAAHIKPPPYPYWVLDRNPMNHSECSSIASVKPPFVHHTSTRRWYSNVWLLPYSSAPSPTTSTSTHPPPCTNSSYVQPTTSAWRKCKPFTPNSAMTTPPTPPTPPPTPPHNLTHALIPVHANPANLASPDTPPSQYAIETQD